jgi:hypothetical protein
MTQNKTHKTKVPTTYASYSTCFGGVLTSDDLKGNSKKKIILNDIIRFFLGSLTKKMEWTVEAIVEGRFNWIELHDMKKVYRFLQEEFARQNDKKKEHIILQQLNLCVLCGTYQPCLPYENKLLTMWKENKHVNDVLIAIYLSMIPFHVYAQDLFGTDNLTMRLNLLYRGLMKNCKEAIYVLMKFVELHVTNSELFTQHDMLCLLSQVDDEHHSAVNTWFMQELIKNWKNAEKYMFDVKYLKPTGKLADWYKSAQYRSIFTFMCCTETKNIHFAYPLILKFL